MKKTFFMVLFLLPLFLFAKGEETTPKVDMQGCTYKNTTLKGKVKVVNSFADIKVQVVTSFPDIKVKVVNSFPDDCGEWQFVESFPDFTIQFVNSFPDIKVQFVDSFPGVN